MDQQSLQTGQSAIARQILSYLTEHPQSQDTLEGVVHWWLLEQQIQYGSTQVKAALDELVAQRLVIENAGRDGQVRYSFNQEKLRQIRELLDQNPIENAATTEDPSKMDSISAEFKIEK